MGRRVHVVGNFAFPTLITQLALKASVEWVKDDEMPTITRSKEFIPHGVWYKSQAMTRWKGKSQAFSSEAGSSSAPDYQ
ncbi:hypothetical protein AHAS_Ahas13G0251200 [Arachis hypogaea]